MFFIECRAFFLIPYHAIFLSQIYEMNRTNETLQENMKGMVDTESKDR